MFMAIRPSLKLSGAETYCLSVDIVSAGGLPIVCCSMATIGDSSIDGGAHTRFLTQQAHLYLC